MTKYIRTLIILVQEKNTSLKLPVGVSPLQLVYLHRNWRYFVIKIYVIFIHLFDSGILLIIDLNKKKGKKGGWGEFYL
jgi:hypothetical protein